VRLKLDECPVVILGTNGNIAKEVASAYPAATLVPRAEYLTWLAGGEARLNSFLRNLKLSPKIIFNCVGATNPAAHESLLLELNFELPKLLLSSAIDVVPKIVTFGTVMENIQRYSLSNNYLKSKFLFHEWLLDKNQNGNYLHLQLHTLYGGTNIHKHMFLGQIHHAIKNREIFSMSSGVQIREYHHIQDDVTAALEIVNRGLIGTLPISHGDPVKLRDLAEFVFSYFDCLNLLDIGKFTTNEFDALRPISHMNQECINMQFRDSKTGIIEWLSANL